MTKLKNAQRRLIPALRPEIEKGDITIELNNDLEDDIFPED